MTHKELLENCVDKTIISVEVICEDDNSNTVSYCIFHFSDDSKLEISPSSFNYGPQVLFMNKI